jgi:hypothetical protein
VIITDIAALVPQVPALLRETYMFMRWSVGQHMNHETTDDDWDDEFEAGEMPLSMHEAGRVALEFIMVGRLTKDKPEEFREMMSTVVEEIDCPQHAIDVVMTLASMVNTLAEDDDLLHFGQHILHEEAARL